MASPRPVNLPATEPQAEELAALRQLVQSPGWAHFNHLVLKRVESNEREKAKALRDQNPSLAMSLQARVDGLRESLDLIVQRMEGLHEVLEEAEGSGIYPWQPSAYGSVTPTGGVYASSRESLGADRRREARWGARSD